MPRHAAARQVHDHEHHDQHDSHRCGDLHPTRRPLPVIVTVR
nr:hypothetical protein [Streptomyces sp. F8]